VQVYAINARTHRADHADFHLEVPPAPQYPSLDSIAAADRQLSGAFPRVHPFGYIQK
jgi:hypothetical protein